MPKFNVSETIKKAEDEYGLGKGEYFKVQEGYNRIRVLSEFVLHEGEYNGKKTYKFVAWILDRRDEKVKPYYMPRTIVDELAALQVNPEYRFEEVPMPYDITINAVKPGTLDVEYKVIPARQNSELTAEEKAAFAEKPTVQEYLAKVKEGASERAATPADVVAQAAAQPAQSHPFDDGVPIEDVPL